MDWLKELPVGPMAGLVQSTLRIRVGNLRILVLCGPLPRACDPPPDDPDPIGQPPPVFPRRHLHALWVDRPASLSNCA